MPWFLGPLVFLARICDVSIGTVRVITVIRGHKLLATLLAFGEVSIWIFAVSAVIVNIRQNLWMVFFYAGGYATGTLIGMLIEEKIALGNQMIRVVNTDGSLNVAAHLRERGYTVTQVEAAGALGRAELSFLVVPRKHTKEALETINAYSPSAFITVEDVRMSTHRPRLIETPPSHLPIWKRLIKFE